MVKKDTPVVLLMNGPNLNMLGKRSKTHYGSFTFEQVEIAFKAKASSLGVDCAFFQSNDEGQLVTAIHEAMKYASGIVLNAGAHTHYSYAILDAIEVCGLPVMEVHISNVHRREAFRHISVIQQACVDQVFGLGLDSYLVGLEKLVKEHIFTDRGGFSDVPDSEKGKVELSDLRSKISEVDGELMKVFNKRMSISAQVGRYKLQNGSKKVYDPDREAEVIELVRQRTDEGLSSQVDSLMKTILRISRERQYDILLPEEKGWEQGKLIKKAGTSLTHVKHVVFAGTQGSYSEMAAIALFPEEKRDAVPTFSEACNLVMQQKADIAILPLENTTAGTVDDVYHLLQTEDIYIVSATSVRVSHKLAIVPGAELSDIRTVTSHPQGISQCSNAISEHGWETKASGNTAFAAQEVAKKGDKSLAAIASEDAALRNGLTILPLDICNSSYNRTRFIAISRKPVILPRSNRISILMHISHQSGSLVSALQVFSDRGLNLCSIISRPIPDVPWEYAFFLDFQCEKEQEAALLSLYQLSQEMPYLKFLGWYEDLS